MTTQYRAETTDPDLERASPSGQLSSLCQFSVITAVGANLIKKIKPISKMLSYLFSVIAIEIVMMKIEHNGVVTLSLPNEVG